MGFNYIQGKKKFVIGSIIADGILLLIPSTMDCLTYITSIIIYKYREVSVYDFNFESTYIFYDDPQICILAFLLIFIPLFLSAVIAIDKQKYTLAILALLPGVFIELLFTITPPWYFLACYVLYVFLMNNLLSIPYEYHRHLSLILFAIHKEYLRPWLSLFLAGLL